jgi:hypothetical protein
MITFCLVLGRQPLFPRVVSSLLGPPLGLVDPLVVSVAALVKLGLCDALEQLTDEADKVVSPQRILPQPLCTLVLLLLELFLVANLARSQAEIAHAGHEVEADLGGGVAADAALQDGDDLLGEFARGARAVGDGCGLQAIELVELVVYRRVAVGGVSGAGRWRGKGLRDEVVDIVVLGRGALCLVDKRRRACKRVVCLADQVGVGERLSPQLVAMLAVPLRCRLS